MFAYLDIYGVPYMRLCVCLHLDTRVFLSACVHACGQVYLTTAVHFSPAFFVFPDTKPKKQTSPFPRRQQQAEIKKKDLKGAESSESFSYQFPAF